MGVSSIKQAVYAAYRKIIRKYHNKAGGYEKKNLYRKTWKAGYGGWRETVYWNYRSAVIPRRQKTGGTYGRLAGQEKYPGDIQQPFAPVQGNCRNNKESGEIFQDGIIEGRPKGNVHGKLGEPHLFGY